MIYLFLHSNYACITRHEHVVFHQQQRVNFTAHIMQKINTIERFQISKYLNCIFLLMII